MRNKIIAVNAVIVLLVGLLSFAIVRTQLSLATTNTDQLKRSAQHDAAGVAARLQLDALRAERWLSLKAADPAMRAALTKATPDARADSARALADQLAREAPGALASRPSMVAIVDANGKILARSGSDLGRGDDVASAYPAFKEALGKSAPGSDIWTDQKRADQYVTSYAPLRDDTNRTIMLVVGVALNDALSRVTEASAGRGVLLVNAQGDVLANAQTGGEAQKAVKDGAADVKGAIATGNVIAANKDDILFAIAPLDGFGKRESAVVAIAPTSLLDGANGVPLSILGVMVLGLVLVIAGGWFLGNYISQPLATLEEGLLAILNGQSDKRFDLDHAELGGLAFRIDQLLNQLMGVEEDNTDEQGRVSKAPSPAAMAAMDADKSGPLPGTAPDASEPADQYYSRLYAEYIAAKKSLGEPVDHITSETFTTRIQGMEAEAQAKHQRPVRFQVQVNGREVVLLAVPL